MTPFFPYAEVPHAGGRFVYDIVHGLSKKHTVYLLSRITPDELKFVDTMRHLCQKIYLYPFKNPHKRNLFGLIWIALSYVVLGLKANRLVRKGEFDLAQIEFVETGLMIRSTESIPMILDVHDVLAGPWKRRYLNTRGLGRFTHYLFWKLLEIAERHIYKKFDLIFTLSQHDRDLVLNMGITRAVEVISHPAGSRLDFTKCDVKEEPYTLLFLGAMNRDANILAVLYFYRNILPHIRSQVPQVKFYVVGNGPPVKITNLAVQDPNVMVTGYVDRVEPYYLKATVFVSPIIIGGGIIAKNLDAMAAGRAVVTTTLGNEGIGATPGKEILVADDPLEFAEKVISLLKDNKLRTEIARNGQEFVKNNFGFDFTIDRIESLYTFITAARA